MAKAKEDCGHCGSKCLRCDGTGRVAGRVDLTGVACPACRGTGRWVPPCCGGEKSYIFEHLVDSDGRLREFRKRLAEPEPTPSPWTAVDDGLPERGLRVLAYMRYADDSGHAEIAARESVGQGWLLDHSAGRSCFTHWMPLPAPPSDEETGDE